MSNYVCEKCGETANSKCAVSRNVFPTDQIATMIGNCIHYTANRMLPRDEKQAQYFPSDSWKFELTIEHLRANDEQEAIATALQWLKQADDHTRKALCDHHWKLTAPKCQLGCCTRD